MTLISEKNIQEFSDYGATKIEGFYSDDEIESIDLAIREVSKSPSPMVDIFEKDQK